MSFWASPFTTPEIIACSAAAIAIVGHHFLRRLTPTDRMHCGANAASFSRSGGILITPASRPDARRADASASPFSIPIEAAGDSSHAGERLSGNWPEVASRRETQGGVSGLFNWVRVSARDKGLLTRFIGMARGTNFAADNQSERAVSRSPAFTTLRVQSFQEPTRSFRVRFSALSVSAFHTQQHEGDFLKCQTIALKEPTR